MTFLSGFPAQDANPGTYRSEDRKVNVMSIKTMHPKMGIMQKLMMTHVKKMLKSALELAGCRSMLFEKQKVKIPLGSVCHILPGSMLVLHLKAF